MEEFGLEGISKGHLAQEPCNEQAHLQMTNVSPRQKQTQKVGQNLSEVLVLLSPGSPSSPCNRATISSAHPLLPTETRGEEQFLSKIRCLKDNRPFQISHPGSFYIRHEKKLPELPAHFLVTFLRQLRGLQPFISRFMTSR